MNPSYGPFVSRKLALEKGLKHYFTGNPCKHGHVARRWVHSYGCDDCLKIAGRRYDIENPDKKKARRLAWNRANPEKVKQHDARKYAKNREHCVARQVIYRRRRLDTDTAYRILHNLRSRTRDAITGRHGAVKDLTTLKLIGCTIEHLQSYFEPLFTPGMTWDNYGEWHIDHIRPCASFDLTDPAQQRECFHYTNLQPLWAEDNIRKSDNWLPDADGRATCCPAT